jgi:hypothetical protein
VHGVDVELETVVSLCAQPFRRSDFEPLVETKKTVLHGVAICSTFDPNATRGMGRTQP